MTLFESLLMAHLAGDWLFQTEWQALNKATSWRAMLTHMFVYHACILAVLAMWFGFADMTIYVVVAVMAVVHIILDRKRPVLGLIRMLRIAVEREPTGWLAIAVDQSLHLLLLGAATLVLTR